MNVIVSNKYQSMLANLNIDIIKRLDGEFDADELGGMFKNFFFQRMVLDITALKNYRDIRTLQKLSILLDMDKIILLLDDSEETTSSEFLSKLVSIGIYNFTKNVDGIMYLYNNPNTYRDVAHIHQLDVHKELEQTIVVENVVQTNTEGPKKAYVLGVKNVNKQAGATSLVYMMKKQLQKNYDVLAIEVDKSDFVYLQDKEMIHVAGTEIGNTIAKNSDKEVILVDVNGSSSAIDMCDDVIYLIEPSVIKLNRMMLMDNMAIKRLSGKKIVLNQSLINSKDILDFEYEARTKIFYNLPPLDERDPHNVPLNAFLVRLGFERQKDSETENRKKILGLF